MRTFKNDIIDRKGIRLGDSCTVFPCIGNKKRLTLNRTKIDFSDRNEQIENGILLPNLSKDNFYYSLYLSNERYYLKSNCEIPFRINGTYSFESFVERGDEILMAHNKVIFQRDAKSCEYAHAILEEENVIKSDINILIEGETGTGKTILAKKIHELSERKGRFIHVNLSSFSENLIESELFGHVKGAFTGAISEKKGAILEAKEGTLFLDEIDSISIDIQTKLLIFLESKEIRTVGGNRTIKCDTRIIFASGRSLEKLLLENRIRKDFYFRITSGIKLNLRPLRESPEDVKRLCHEFEKDENIFIPDDLISFYQTLSWPGNIRQLMTHLRKKKIVSKNHRLIFDEYDEELSDSNAVLKCVDDMSFSPLEDFVFKYVSKAYRYFDGKINKTAQALNISERRLKSILIRHQSLNQL